mmetsp:Transcript_15512/g.31383  ORF Transcript_15512/g.31383 Transcript_15512/m.31383 type:complete len:461 (-) Transcript_15512:600-1982(-)
MTSMAWATLSTLDGIGRVQVRPRLNRLVCCASPRTVFRAQRSGLAEDPERARQRARLIEHGGDLRLAREIYREICLLRDPSNGKAWRDWAKVELRLTGDSRSTQEILHRGVRANPDNPFLLVTIGVVYLRSSLVQRARRAFEKALALDPANLHASLSWAKLEAAEGNLDMARRIFKAAESFTQNVNARMYHTWGAIEARAGNHLAARDLFEQGLLCDPENEFILVSMGQFAAAGGEADLARRLFSRAISKLVQAPVDSESGVQFVLECWGRLELQQGDFEKARSMFGRAVKIAPTDGAALLGLATAESALGNFELAHRHLDVALELFPSSSLLWRQRATIQAREGKKKSMRACFLRALRADRDDWMVYEDWCIAEILIGTPVETARSLMDKSFSMRFRSYGKCTSLACTMDDKVKIETLDRIQRRQLRPHKRPGRGRENDSGTEDHFSDYALEESASFNT